ncbi:MAG: histidinol-phosphatase HisJ family protein [Firmicutes bacterium]|nr:histidinol-phosphatase HisJ family protein [Bacillota bacterium]
MIDLHVHSSDYSSDASDNIETMVLAAVRKGVTHLALTDHLDLAPDGSLPGNLKDLAAYRNLLEALKEKYSGQIAITAGIEAGYTKKHADKLAKLLDGLDFDFVINSVHEVGGVDCYYPEFYRGKTKQQAYNEYFEAVLESLDAPYPYHSVGHLGYVERTAPYPDPGVHYNEFSKILDAILTAIIRKEKILELNTNVYGSASIRWLPNNEIWARYRELGGTRATFGSDAHRKGRIGEGYGEAAAYLKGLGFKGFAVVSGGMERITNSE